MRWRVPGLTGASEGQSPREATATRAIIPPRCIWISAMERSICFASGDTPRPSLPLSPLPFTTTPHPPHPPADCRGCREESEGERGRGRGRGRLQLEYESGFSRVVKRSHRLRTGRTIEKKMLKVSVFTKNKFVHM